MSQRGREDRVTRLRHRGAGLDEGGFTLLEVIIVVAILALIIGPITASVMVGFNAVSASSASLNQAADRQLVQLYLPRDVQSATSATTYQNQCDSAHAATTALSLDWGAIVVAGSPPTTSAQPNEVDYVLQAAPQSGAAPPTWRLIRNFYIGCVLQLSTIVAYNLEPNVNAALADPVTTTNAAGTITTVTMTLTDASTAVGEKGAVYSVSATQRAQPPPSTTTTT